MEGRTRVGRQVQAVLQPGSGKVPAAGDIQQRRDGEDAWTLHAEARLSLESESPVDLQAESTWTRSGPVCRHWTCRASTVRGRSPA